MVCTTFLNGGELNITLPDRQLQDALDYARKHTGSDWQVVPVKVVEKSFLWWTKTKVLYGLYCYVGGVGPWQQINFYRDNSDTSINLTVPLELVAAYLYGLWGGIDAALAKEKP